MTAFLRDLQQGARQLIRRPGFSAAAIASLALGIGLNTTLFSVVNAVLLRDGPVSRPDRLVEIYTGLTKDFPQLTTSYPDYVDIRQGAGALQGIAASAYVRGILSSGERPILVTGEVISSDYFDVLGIRPTIGRAFREDENAVPGASPVVVVSHGLWQRRFGGRVDAVGETVELSGFVYTVVGIGPIGFTGTIPGIPTDFWAPLMMVDRFEFAGVQASDDNDPGATRLERRGTRWLFLKGRLADGRRIEDARAQIETIFTRLRTAYPVTNDKATVSVLPASNIRFHPMLDGYVRAVSAALLVAVSLVLLIACANVANMLLARGASRRRELAIRTAIGASRARIVRQLLSEGLVLAAAGGVLGLIIAWWAGRALAAFGTGVLPIPVSFNVSLDATVLMFAVGASIATAILFGVAPAWSASKLELVPALKASMEGDSRRRVTLSNVLVVGQLALSLVLLVAGALLARGLRDRPGGGSRLRPAPGVVAVFQSADERLRPRSSDRSPGESSERASGAAGRQCRFDRHPAAAVARHQYGQHPRAGPSPAWRRRDPRRHGGDRRGLFQRRRRADRRRPRLYRGRYQAEAEGRGRQRDAGAAVLAGWLCGWKTDLQRHLRIGAVRDRRRRAESQGPIGRRGSAALFARA